MSTLNNIAILLFKHTIHYAQHKIYYVIFNMIIRFILPHLIICLKITLIQLCD